MTGLDTPRGGARGHCSAVTVAGSVGKALNIYSALTEIFDKCSSGVWSSVTECCFGGEALTSPPTPGTDISRYITSDSRS